MFCKLALMHISTLYTLILIDAKSFRYVRCSYILAMKKNLLKTCD